MRMPNGTTDQYIYFVALDSSDYHTRKTGLSSFTVYRSRNGGAATAYTTPTITEVSSANMPGLYKFLLDEDMTLDAGDDSQEMALHITASGMAPVTRTIEIYRSEGEKVLTYPIDSAESTATAKCLLWFIAMTLNQSALSAGTITVKKTDNSTTMFTQAVTQTSANPITSRSESS